MLSVHIKRHCVNEHELLSNRWPFGFFGRDQCGKFDEFTYLHGVSLGVWSLLASVFMANLPFGLVFFKRYVGGSVSGLTGFFTGLMKGVGAGSRVFELLDRVPAIKTDVGTELPSTRNGDIVFEGVDFTYPSRPNAPVLQKVDLKIQKGTSVAIV